MAGRIIAQLLVATAQVVTRAFAEAYRQAVANAGRAGASGANAAGSSSGGGSGLMSRTTLSIEEAAKILNVPKDAPMKDIEKSFEMLFKANDPAQGGSFYLQSKVYRAKEKFDAEYGRGSGKASDTAERPS